MESDYEYLVSRMKYDPETGDFVRIKSVPGNKGKAGNKAGSVGVYGYVLINFRGVKKPAHRLAWLYMTGDWPGFDIDHMNCDRSDNRWSNLREAPGSINSHNHRQAHSQSKTKLLGASPVGSRFRAQIMFDGKVRHIGVYDTAEEAHQAYLAAKRAHHEGNTL